MNQFLYADAEPTAPYVYQPYPRMLYRAGETCVVASEAEESAAVADGWTRSPADVTAPVTRTARKART